MILKKGAISFRILIMIFMFVPAKLLSQASNEVPSVHSDTLKNDNSRHSLYSSAGYGNNLIYLGSTISQNQPYGYAALTYGYKESLYFTVSTVHLHNLSPFIAFSSGSVNYSHEFNSWFDISSSISGYLVAPSFRYSFRKFHLWRSDSRIRLEIALFKDISRRLSDGWH